MNAVFRWFSDRFPQKGVLPAGYSLVKTDELCFFAGNSEFSGLDPVNGGAFDPKDDQDYTEWVVLQAMFLDPCRPQEPANAGRE